MSPDMSGHVRSRKYGSRVRPGHLGQAFLRRPSVSGSGAVPNKPPSLSTRGFLSGEGFGNSLVDWNKTRFANMSAENASRPGFRGVVNHVFCTPGLKNRWKWFAEEAVFD